MNKSSNDGGERQRKPRLVEIIGAAGAGKTTLFKALGSHPDLIRLGKLPNIQRAANAPFFIRYGLQLLPILFLLYRRTSRGLNRREFAWLTILNGWPFVLQRDVKKGNQVIVLDQGPVYLLAEMRESGPDFLKSEEAEKILQELYCRWAATLDLIVWLDAKDIFLMERIRTRGKEHVVKHETTPIVFDFLARYRRSYEFVVSGLETCSSGLRVLRFDTSELQPGEIVDRLLAELGLIS